MSRLMGVINIALGKTKIRIDVEQEAEIHDLDEDMDTVSARIAFYGELLAACREEQIKADAAYRKWRAQIAAQALRKDPKIGEWKVNAKIESDDQFLTFKQAIAKVEYNVVALKNLIKGLEEKSPNLRSKGARERAVLGSDGMTTPSQETASRRKKELRAAREEQDAKRKKKRR